MVESAVLIDTNAYTAFKKGEKDAIDIILGMSQLFINVIVIGELLGGFAVGNRGLENKRELALFLRLPKVKVLGISDETTKYYAAIYKQLRAKGRPIPTNDIWIAATAQEFKIPVFSYDKHLHFVDDLFVVNKLSDFWK